MSRAVTAVYLSAAPSGSRGKFRRKYRPQRSASAAPRENGSGRDLLKPAPAGRRHRPPVPHQEICRMADDIRDMPSDAADDDDKLHEECGVFGVWNVPTPPP